MEIRAYFLTSIKNNAQIFKQQALQYTQIPEEEV